MTPIEITRRFFLGSITGVVFLLVFPGCGTSVRFRNNETRSLLRMARLLYPHDALADGVYADALAPLNRRAANDPALVAALRDGVADLNDVLGREWLTASADDQVAALAQIVGGTFFTTVQAAVRPGLYEHPEVWRLVGYEGPSAEHGGYLHRGFDDIDWLPEI